MKTHPHDVGDTTGLASILQKRLQDFLSPLLLRLDRSLDRRLVKTFAATASTYSRAALRKWLVAQ
jgi:hypothetical protein